MSDEERKDQAAAPPPPPPMGVDRIEFRRGLNDLRRGQEELACRVYQDAGAILIGLGFFALVTGFRLLRDGLV